MKLAILSPMFSQIEGSKREKAATFSIAASKFGGAEGRT